MEVALASESEVRLTLELLTEEFATPAACPRVTTASLFAQQSATADPPIFSQHHFPADDGVQGSIGVLPLVVAAADQQCDWWETRNSKLAYSCKILDIGPSSRSSGNMFLDSSRLKKKG